MEVANYVASGKLKLELDLSALSDDLASTSLITEVEHSRRSGNRLLIRFEESDALGILAPSGVYVITGAKGQDDAENAKRALLTGLTELSIISNIEPNPDEVIDPFEVQNIVFTEDIGDNQLDLEILAVTIGLEHTEYEPEQFPGLVFREDTTDATILVFSSGKVIITGIRDKQSAKEAKSELENQMKKIQ